MTRFAGLFGRARRERELAAELEGHLALHIEDNLRAGMTPEEARRQALIKLGGLEQAKELYRERGGIPCLETLWQDLRYGARMLAKSPAVTGVVLLSLALGLGANTTIFSFVNSMLFRPPAVEAPGQLVEFWNRVRNVSGLSGVTPLSSPDYFYYRDANQVFSGVAATDGDPGPAVWSHGGAGEVIDGQLVSANFFSVLGVRAVHGRTFTTEEGGPTAKGRVVVLSHEFWQRRLNADPSVLGRTLTLDGTSFTVVGVAPPRFGGVLVGLAPDFWAPLSVAPLLTRDPQRLVDRQTSWLFAFGRLKPGIDRARANVNLAVLSSRLQRNFPKSNGRLEIASAPLDLVPGPFRGIVGGIAAGLMVIVGLVLMIACANVANLLLAKATGRRHEMAVRSALGAGRARLIRQMLTESLLLSLSGGVGAVLLSLWIVPLLLALIPPGLPLRLDAPFDGNVLGFTFLLAFVTGLALGLVPALHSTRTGDLAALREEVPRASSGRSRLRGALVILQVATCLLLLIGAGLCIRSLGNAGSIDPGFDTRHEAVVELDPEIVGYSAEQGRVYYGRLMEDIRRAPGVVAAGRANYLPLAIGETVVDAKLESAPSAVAARGFGVNLTDVSPGFFTAIGTPIVRGRDFNDGDVPGAPRVVVINEAMASRSWPGENPLGRRLLLGSGADAKDYEVVGVVKTAKVRTLGEDPTPVAYRSLLQFYSPRTTLVVRAAGDPRFLLGTIRREVESIDANIVPTDLETMTQHLELPLFPAHAAALMFGVFGLLGLVLAITGLYGVMSYGVAQRAREIAIRVALGARRERLLRFILGQGMLLALVGETIGLVAALGLTRFLSSLLYGIRPVDPLTFVTVPVLLAAVATLASYIPARRALNAEPMAVLRHE